jgi:hypothetical protein
MASTQACCPSTAPPFAPSTTHKAKGKYETIYGLSTCKSLLLSCFVPFRLTQNSKTDVTGSPTSKKAILLVYDIFGFFPQTIQGADLLAEMGDGWQVFMPDFFEAEPADIAW